MQRRATASCLGGLQPQAACAQMVPSVLIGMPQVSQAVFIEKTSTLAKAKGVLTRVTYRFRNRHGEWKDNTREVYDNGNSAVVLPDDPDRGTIVFDRQLRLPAFLQDGKETMIEACAGKLEDEAPEHRMIEEIEEESVIVSTPSSAFRTLHGRQASASAMKGRVDRLFLRRPGVALGAVCGPPALADFSKGLRGPVIAQRLPEFEEARKLYKVMIDKCPLVIASLCRRSRRDNDAQLRPRQQSPDSGARRWPHHARFWECR